MTDDIEDDDFSFDKAIKEQQKEQEGNLGFFEPIDDDTHKEVDKLIKKKIEPKKSGDISLKPSMDRVRIAHEIRTNPPKEGFMKVNVEPGIYSIDLNIDAHWWFNHVCTVFPFLIDQAVRTHVDIRDSFKPEKRKLDFQYWWLLLIPILFIVGLLIMNMFFKIF